MHAKLLQAGLTLCDPTDYSPPGSSVRGLLQARILEWVAMSFSRDLPDPGIEPVSPVAPVLQANSLLLSHWGRSAINIWVYSFQLRSKDNF